LEQNMWKSRPDDSPERPQPSSSTTPNPVTATPTASPAKDTRTYEPPPKLQDALRAEVAHIGKSVKVKGELSGSEDLYFDGEADGSVDLHEHTLTIGPNARIRATLSAREVVIHGRVEGNVCASEKVELKRSCSLTGDLCTKRIVIEDGAFFKGAIDIQKEGKPEFRKAAPVTASAPAPAAVDEVPEFAATGPQASFLDDK
jgi:cytoskeletal protein CcmA (bactofilin family)